MRLIGGILLIAMLAGAALQLPAQAPVAPAKPAAQAVAPPPKPRIMTPAEAAKIAAEDITNTLNVPEHDRPFVLYAYFEQPLPIKAAAYNYAVNTAINSTELWHTPAIIGDGYVARVFLHHLAEGKKLATAIDLLENKLAFADPYFHKRGLIRRGDKYFLKVFNEPDGTPIKPYRAVDGKTYDFRIESIRREDQYALHLDEYGIQNILLLHGLTGRDLPIVRADWFQNIILTTINVGLTKGLYYDFLGVRGLKRKEVYALFGYDQATIDRLGSESRAAFISKISDRLRVAVVAFTQAVRPTAGLGLLMETRDIALGDVDEGQDAILNLRNFKPSAFEVFIIDANGRIVFLLFDGNDVLQDVVPDQVAHDFTVESPSPKTLVPAVSCICCHGTWKHQVEGSAEPSLAKMFIEFDNEVLAMYASTFSRNRKGSIVAEGKRLRELIAVHAQYGGDLKNVLRLAAAFHSGTVFENTGHQIFDIATSIEEDRDGYCYTHLDNRAVLRRLGHDIEPQGVKRIDQIRYLAKRFNEVVPPPPADAYGLSDEDGRILRLRNELMRLVLTPSQFEAVAADLYLTAWQAKKAKSEPKG